MIDSSQMLGQTQENNGIERRKLPELAYGFAHKAKPISVGFLAGKQATKLLSFKLRRTATASPEMKKVVGEK